MSTSPNIFIVDDDMIYQFTAGKTIESIKCGATISIFPNGEKAINFLAENVDNAKELPDIIFLDINMPVMDGWQFLEAYNKLKQLFCKKIIIYMVSSSSDREDIEKSRDFFGVDDYIVKPILRDRYKEIVDLFNFSGASQSLQSSLQHR